jgi:hypothetical protein
VTYLIDHDGQKVNEWVSAYRPMPSYLIGSELVASDETGVYAEGDMIRSGVVPARDGDMSAPGESGIVELYSWEGDLKWQFELSEIDDLSASPDGHRDLRLHHDIEVMPNGNILMIAWERFNFAEATANGRDPNELEASDRWELWPDAVIEVDPSIHTVEDIEGRSVKVSDRNAIVWQWSLWDHVVQDRKPGVASYGAIADNPHRVDLNYVPGGPGAGDQFADWTHFNSIDYNEYLDQIVVSSREFSEFWVIDHSPKTLETFPGEGTLISKGGTGGRSGMGGRILYRWGSPHVYERGTLGDQQMRYQHDAKWIDRDIDPGQNFVVFDNGWDRAGTENWSQVHEIDSPDDQQWILNNETDGTATNLEIFGTRALNYVDDFAGLDHPWSASWVPITGDWDNVHSDGAGFYDPDHNVWIVTNHTGAVTAWTDLAAYGGHALAQPDWLPIAGDWDKVAGDSAGMYDPVNNRFYLSNGVNSWADFASFDGPAIAGQWLPVSGDWDGDGYDTVGLYDPRTGDWLFSNTVGSWSTSIDLPAPGIVGSDWLPIAGDWNGDGRDTVGLYDPASNNWYLNNLLDGTLDDLIIINAPDDVPYKWTPVAGDWNGSGTATVGLYDPSFYSILPGEPFAPESANWTYASTPRSEFFATIISGAQRLPNGNTLINEGTEGRFFEVTPQSEIVWEYKNPVVFGSPLAFDQPIPPMPPTFDIPGVFLNLTFRIYRYPTDYTSQFSNADGSELKGDAPIEVYPDYFDTPGLYDPVTNDWQLNNHADGTITDMVEFNTHQDDPSEWIPVAGDWNGNDFDTAGLYNAEDRQFYLNNNVDGSIAGYVTIQVPAGLVGATWKPVIGDWDGDGVDEVGLYDPASNDWLLNTGDTTWSSLIVVTAPVDVPASWVPITGDWDGDGYDTVGLYDPSTNNWYLNNQLNGQWSTAIGPSGEPLGIELIAPVRVPSTWVPITGDWNGNGKDTVGLFDPSTGDWFLNNRVDGTISDLLIVGGRGEPVTQLPVTGDWDGTGAALAGLPLAEGERAMLPPARNPFNPTDANADGVSTPSDLLSVVNAINNLGVSPLVSPLPGIDGRGLYVDVNGDNLLSAADVLRLVIHLNSHLVVGTHEAVMEPFALPAGGDAGATPVDFTPFESSPTPDASPIDTATETPARTLRAQGAPAADIVLAAAAEQGAWKDELLEDVLDDVAETIEDGWSS